MNLSREVVVKLFLWVAVLSMTAQANAASERGALDKSVDFQLSDIARNAYGGVDYMSQPDAAAYCESIGQRLPRTREWAQYAQSLGAQGISDLPKDGYYFLAGFSNSWDRFYFSPKGYQRPTGIYGDLWYWSSAFDSAYPDESYVLHGDDGHLVLSNSSYAHGVAVRCVHSD